MGSGEFDLPADWRNRFLLSKETGPYSTTASDRRLDFGGIWLLLDDGRYDEPDAQMTSEIALADKSRRKRILRYAPLVLWTGVILYLGSAQGAMSETSRFIGPLLRFLFADAAPETLQVYHGYIRKFAHFAEYALLAALAIGAFRNSAIRILREHRLGVVFFTVLAVASVDEFVQSFNPSRTGSPYDVALDLSGGVAIIALFWLIGKRKPSVA